ncbi:MAG: cytochrome c5 family protein [Sulfuritalea sp.]|nr:cytochrome c5 family protein [Sulfuritalea sp.]
MNPRHIRFLARAGAFALIPAAALAMGERPGLEDYEAANLRIQPVAKVKLAPPAAAGPAVGSRSGEELYKAVCGACHTAGVAGAPKTGDRAAWAPLLRLGLEGLTQTAITGKGAMPPRGGSNATDEELVRAIIHMANQSGADFK